MRPISSVDQVFAAIEQAKSSAPAYCTNFFPVRSKLESWIEHGTLNMETAPGVVFFFRKDRDFEHLYFCAAEPSALERELVVLPLSNSAKLSADLVGSEASIQPQVDIFQKANLKRHTRLLRLSRSAKSSPVVESSTLPDDFVLTVANESNAEEILKLIEGSFNAYVDQLPALYELKDAIAASQILAVKHNGRIAAALYFETHGLTSVLRYWVVGEQFRSQHLGSALLKHYFKSQDSVVRFNLWVSDANSDALAKYERFGYKPDGLLDQVMTSAAIHA